MNKKEFIVKSKEIFDRFKESIRQSSALQVGSVVGFTPAVTLSVMMQGVDAYYREKASTITGVVGPASPEVLDASLHLVMQGAIVASGVYAAVLLAKGAVNISDRLDELERIKFERGERPDNPSNYKGNRGAVKLTDKEIAQRDMKLESSEKNKAELSPLDAFYQSQGYFDKKPESSGAENKKQAGPRLN